MINDLRVSTVTASPFWWCNSDTKRSVMGGIVLLIISNFTGYIYIVITVPISILIFAPMWIFNVPTYRSLYLWKLQLNLNTHWSLSVVMVAVQPGPRITNVFATRRNNFSQWHRSFQRKLLSHWLKFLRHVAITLVIQGPVVVVAATHVFLILKTDGLVQERRNSSKLTMELRFSCTNPSKWQPQARPAMVGGHSGYFFCFRNSERLMTCYLPWYYFCSIALVLWSLAWVHKLYFHPANIKFTNIFHYCRACFSFSGLHASGQIWPN